MIAYQLIMIVVVVWSYDDSNNYYCRATTEFRTSNMPPSESWISDSRHRPEREITAPTSDIFLLSNWSCPIENGNLTAADISLRHTSDTLSKFLPFITTANIHTQCYKHTIMYLTQLNDFKLWATKSEHQTLLLLLLLVLSPNVTIR